MMVLLFTNYFELTSAVQICIRTYKNVLLGIGLNSNVKDWLRIAYGNATMIVG